MANPAESVNVYTVFALPPDDVAARIQTLIDRLSSEFGGPQFIPHITVVGPMRLTLDDAREKFRSACEGLKAYQATVDRVSTGALYYQCVYLHIHPTTEVMETSSHCCEYFGYKDSTPYMPHLSLLYGNLSDEKKEQAKETVSKLDETICDLSFSVTRLALYKTGNGDGTPLESWEKTAEHHLPSY